MQRNVFNFMANFLGEGFYEGILAPYEARKYAIG